MIERLTAALEGRYRIEQELGEGGMAMVYLAHDLRHDRQVAVKVLRPELAAVVGAERFLAEIKTTANLQHPHILPLFDSGEADSFLFYVMPHVEGESLRERLEKERQLPVKEAVAIAEKIAAALQYAHEQGVVHRDVKPANILLSRGEPLVADFGIALALSEAGGGRITETGLSLGTPHYMSPEQAAGERIVDKRSDVYAVACVLYEMLTGQPPYGGPTVQAVLGRILTGDPTPPTEHRKAIPTNVEHTVLKALEKLPADRFESAADFIRALENPSFRYGGEAVDVAGSGTGWSRGRVAASLAAVAVLAFLASGLVRPFSSAPEEPETIRHRVLLGAVNGFSLPPNWIRRYTALEPTGAGVVFADTLGSGEAGWQLWFKEGSEVEAIPLPNTQEATTPTFSPDGEWLAFFVDNELRKQPLRGGTSVLLADSAGGGNTHALAWLEDGTILYEDQAFNLRMIDEDGGEWELLAGRDEVGAPLRASGLRGGGGGLLVGCMGRSCPPGSTRLFLVDLERDTIHPLVDDVSGAWHVEGERVVYADSRGAVFAAPLDREGLALGTPVPLFDGVQTSGTAEMQLAADGSLLIRRGEATGDVAAPEQIVWVDRDGNPTPVDADWYGNVSSMVLSPDQTLLAFTDQSPDEGLAVWVKELPDGPTTRLTPDRPLTRRPVWTPDGRHVVYTTPREDSLLVFDVRRFDASTPARRFLEMEWDGSGTPEERNAVGLQSISFSRDGRYAVFRVGGDPEGDLHYLEMADGDTTRHELLLRAGTNEITPALSPDARWVAYVSDVSGTQEVYVRPFPDATAARVKVSEGGGWVPRWSADGSELFYVDAEGNQVAASVQTDPTLRITAREPLFQIAGNFGFATSHPLYDVAPDRGFVMYTFRGNTGSADQNVNRVELLLVENWFTELRRGIGDSNPLSRRK